MYHLQRRIHNEVKQGQWGGGNASKMADTL